MTEQSRIYLIEFSGRQWPSRVSGVQKAKSVDAILEGDVHVVKVQTGCAYSAASLMYRMISLDVVTVDGSRCASRSADGKWEN